MPTEPTHRINRSELYQALPFDCALRPLPIRFRLKRYRGQRRLTGIILVDNFYRVVSFVSRGPGIDLPAVASCDGFWPPSHRVVGNQGQPGNVLVPALRSS